MDMAAPSGHLRFNLPDRWNDVHLDPSTIDGGYALQAARSSPPWQTLPDKMQPVIARVTSGKTLATPKKSAADFGKHRSPLPRFQPWTLRLHQMYCDHKLCDDMISPDPL
jgi:hypothetical protein